MKNKYIRKNAAGSIEKLLSNCDNITKLQKMLFSKMKIINLIINLIIN